METCPDPWVAGNWTSDWELTCRVLNVAIDIVSGLIGNVSGVGDCLVIGLLQAGWRSG